MVAWVRTSILGPLERMTIMEAGMILLPSRALQKISLIGMLLTVGLLTKTQCIINELNFEEQRSTS